MKQLTPILVTGCGGDIGMGIGRILKDIFPDAGVIGADATNDHPGDFIFDRCTILPRADTEGYLDELRKVTKESEIRCIIPTSEAEIRFFHQSGIRDIDGTPLIVANSEALEVGLDKLKTNEFLRAQHLPAPWTHLVKDGPPQELPCIVKSRFGRGSRGVLLVDANSVDFLMKSRPEDIWQEHLLPDDEEYTCGVYGCMDGSVRSIIMRRKLAEGLTVMGEVVERTQISDLIGNLARSVALRGPINVQLRLTSKGPMIFEINPRFSSTVVFRHKLGFQDVRWSLEEKAGSVASPYVPPRTGTRFYKGYMEYIA